MSHRLFKQSLQTQKNLKHLITTKLYKKTKLILATGLVVTFSMAVQADETSQLKTRSVSIFKNNSAFFIKQGEVTTNEGKFVITKDLPKALFGTFWVTSPNNQLKHVRSYNDLVTTKEEVIVNDFTDMLAANKGKRMKIHIGKDEVYEGMPVEMITKNDKGEETRSVNNAITVFKTTSGEWLSFKPTEIRRIQFLQHPNQVWQNEVSKKQQVLEVGFTTNKSKQPIDMMYLQNGINWTPNYLIELDSEDKATLTLIAEVVNNAEDINQAEVNFVVGVPNFKYSDKLSGLLDFANMMADSNESIFSQQRYVNAMSNSFDGLPAPESIADDKTVLTSNAVASGNSEEDLYFYTVKDMSLEKEGRGHYPILKNKLNIKHIYEANISQNSINQGAYTKAIADKPSKTNTVVHYIEFRNQSTHPFTSGTAMVVNNQSGDTRPISQDKLYYTPVGGSSRIKLTESPDVHVTHTEREIKRKQNALQESSSDGKQQYVFDLVTVEGKIKVQNYKKKKVDLQLSRTIQGNVLKSSEKWHKDGQVNRSGMPNQLSNVTWKPSLKAGQKLEITYSYEVYIRQQ